MRARYVEESLPVPSELSLSKLPCAVREVLLSRILRAIAALLIPIVRTCRTRPITQLRVSQAHNFPGTLVLIFRAGLIIHQPRSVQMSESPFYSLVRAFATATNTTWFQSNIPAASDIIEPRPIPQWAEHISRTVKVLIPEAMALQGLDWSDNEESNDEFDLPDDAGKQVHPHKMRIWGLVASPGGGATAVLVSKHSTVRPERNCKTQVRFGWTPPKDIPGAETLPIIPDQTTESRVWERMYGGGPAVKGVALAEGDGKSPTLNEDGKLQKQFNGVLTNQRCVYCQATLRSLGRQTKCQNNHIFGKYFPADLFFTYLLTGGQ